MTDFPQWLRTEEAVKEFFHLLGFFVQSASISGRQIDIIAQRTDALTGGREVYVIEVTLEKVGVKKGSRDGQKLLLARQEHNDARLMLVSLAGFTDDQAATLQRLGIITKRFHELEATALPLYRYAVNAQKELGHSVSPDIGYHPNFYIEPEIEFRDSGSNNSLSASEWIDSILINHRPGLCAVLGSLGSGKTSLLKRFLEKGISRFIEDPDMQPLPLYIPLGRYKQHAGDLDQMIMAELRRSGISNYPSSLVRFLMEEKRIIVLMDGLDEVHPIQNADDVLETVTNILGGVGKNATGVLSCRRQFFESSNEELAYFGSYTGEKLKGLNNNLQKMLRGNTSTYICSILPFDIQRIKQYLSIRCNMSSEQSDLLLSQYYGFQEMATTPVLLAMIATTVTEGTLNTAAPLSFPLIELYDAYTNRWIERDVGRTRLNANQRKHFSEHLADQMFWNSRDSAEWRDLSKALRDDPEWGNNSLTIEEAERDIRNSGFLIREIDDRWRFVHRSILEYFAARTELGRLVADQRPRDIPTDGYALFLSELIANYWLQHHAPPFPAHSWRDGRGEEVRVNQWSLLAAASMRLPESENAELADVGTFTSRLDSSWKNIAFRRLLLTITSGALSFLKCKFINSHIAVTEESGYAVTFSECDFEESTIRFETFPNWRTSYDAANREAVDVPAAVIEFSRFVELGAQVFIAEHQWLLRLNELNLFLECGSRLQGKAYLHNFKKGSYGGELENLLPRLIQSGLVNEDKSRQAHQLSWTTRGRSLFTKLRTDPVAAQRELCDLLFLK